MVVGLAAGDRARAGGLQALLPGPPPRMARCGDRAVPGGAMDHLQRLAWPAPVHGLRRHRAVAIAGGRDLAGVAAGTLQPPPATRFRAGPGRRRGLQPLSGHPMIKFNKPYMTGGELALISQAHAAGHRSGDGQFARQCHEWLERQVGCRKALLTHSCTAALEMSALLLDLEPGDEVIMPSFTFV